MEPILNIVKNRVESYGYKSAKFRLALVREQTPTKVIAKKHTLDAKIVTIIDVSTLMLELWKVSVARVVLDVEDPQGHETLIKENNFALEDFSVSIDTFYEFLKYLDRVNVRNITFENNLPKLYDDMFFAFGDYKLCFIGNFPGSESYFYGRNVSKQYHGIDRPIYLADYALHQSSIGNLHKIDLTGHEIPLRNAIDAINHFWGTNYEQHNLTNYCNIYMPVYDAGISSCDVKDDHLITMIDVNTNRVKVEDLSISIIIDRPNEYRKRVNLVSNKLDMDIGFIPDYGSAFLFKNKEKLDEYNFESQSRKLHVAQLMSQIQDAPITRGSKSPKGMKESHLLEHSIIRLLPKNVENLLVEAENAFDAELYRASAILIRSAMEELVTITLQKNGRESDLYDDNRGEIALQRKINLLATIPQYKNLKSDLELIKWFGDKAVHEASMPILRKDIEINMEPKLRMFLTKFVENHTLS